MFDPSDDPRVFALAPGVDFPAALLSGVRDRTKGWPPDQIARIQIIVNTRRMARRIRNIFDAGPAGLMPRITLLTDAGFVPGAHIPGSPVSPLRRRLELVQLVRKLVEEQPDFAPRVSLFDLADSLAELMDEMHGEGVEPDAITGLDLDTVSEHWTRTQTFIGITQQFFGSEAAFQDAQTRLRRMVQARIAHWQAHPPTHPVILAGSTGSRGTAQMLMQAVARLPQGAVVLPGFDFDMPPETWDALSDALTAEDHPQFRFASFLQALDMAPADVLQWTTAATPSHARNRAVSLALRPAPVTHAWLDEGPQLGPLEPAFDNVTLVEAESPRDEALAIALRLRQAAQDGIKAALITPDRMLTRQVSAALDRWQILPDDSAGLPLQLSAPGRLIRHAAQLLLRPLSAEALIEILKHPLCHDGDGRGAHMLLTRDLELDLRAGKVGTPTPEKLLAWASARNSALTDWGTWLVTQFCGQNTRDERPLEEWTDRLRRMVEAISAGSVAQTGGIWDRNAGEKARKVLDALTEDAPAGGDMPAHDFVNLIGALLSREEVRDRDAPDRNIMIWGTLEARVQGADLLILGGLNEGSWPEAAKPDPWLNRSMRKAAGLLLPERRIGLSAHDFQQAIGAPEVWLTRAKRSDDAQTVPSRWLNRMTNLLDGLADTGGKAALANMRAKGNTWLRWAGALESVKRADPAPRPSPRPPLAARPRQLSISGLRNLIRDPYAVYARSVLRLYPLNPLVQAPDYKERGTLFHAVFEEYIKQTLQDPELLTVDGLMRVARETLGNTVPWPTTRLLWEARMQNLGQSFVADEVTRQANATPTAFEEKMRATLTDPPFTIIAKADRLDRDAQGRLRIYDYKTGKPPSANQMRAFEIQLMVEAAMAERFGTENLPPSPVIEASYIGVGSQAAVVPAPIDALDEIWQQLGELLTAYLSPGHGFTARARMERDAQAGDYDQLARFGEWDPSDDPVPEDLT